MAAEVHPVSPLDWSRRLRGQERDEGGLRGHAGNMINVSNSETMREQKACQHWLDYAGGSKGETNVSEEKTNRLVIFLFVVTCI